MLHRWKLVFLGDNLQQLKHLANGILMALFTWTWSVKAPRPDRFGDVCPKLVQWHFDIFRNCSTFLDGRGNFETASFTLLVLSFILHPRALKRARTRVARFLLVQYTKTGKMHQMTTKCTKLTYNIPNGRKIDRMATQYTNIFHCKTVLKFFQIGIFGWKIYHLAALAWTKQWRCLVRYYVTGRDVSLCLRTYLLHLGMLQLCQDLCSMYTGWLHIRHKMNF
jgi:hypothetical protein